VARQRENGVVSGAAAGVAACDSVSRAVAAAKILGLT